MTNTDAMSRFRTRDVDEDQADAFPDRNGHTSSPLADMVSIADYEDEVREAQLTAELANGKTMKFRIVYDPNQIGDALDKRIADYAESGDELAAARVFCEVVSEWNLVGPLTGLVVQYDDEGMIEFDDAGAPLVKKTIIVEAGQPIPLEPEVLQYLRSGMVIAIWKAIREDAAGVPTNRRERRAQQKRSRKPSQRR